MTTTTSFRLIRDEEVPEINARALIYEHKRTGARVLSIVADDTNKVFGITFRTPPSDSTGVPHILEHSVLCGSDKYPVKEPFVELLKGSLQTFLNAFTYPDKTCYPVASENLRDFYNLVDVYLDAVFHPRISEDVFEQEGWHYELESRDEPLTYKGVVFNEMKGAYSSPEDVLGEYSQQSLFPDTTYGMESGGHPRNIPDLTYPAFKSFYDTLYHPSNAYMYFYGDDDPEERLRILDAYLAEYDRLDVDSTIALQPRFDQPRELDYPFDPGDDAAGEAKAMFTINWLLPRITDIDLNLALGILSYALIATPASPLRKALIDSGLGEDLVGAGYGAFMREMYFGTGLRGILESDIETAEKLIYTTLEAQVRDGLDQDIIEAALNTTEFRLRERNTGGYPRGLAYMLSALTFWLYDEDPLSPLRFEAPLARLRETMATEPRYFESLIEEHLLTNQHRTRVILRPVAGYNRQEAQIEQDRLAGVKAGMTDEELNAVMERARQLKDLQSSPDPPEAVATIPFLEREDVNRDNKTIPVEVLASDGPTVLYHDLFTNGILYLDVGFDFKVIPERLLPYLSLFGQALLEMGTAREDFVSLSNRIGKSTGGIGPATIVSMLRNEPGSATWFMLRGKATLPYVDDLLAILTDVLTIPRFDDKERFRQILLEEKAGYEAGIIPGGSSVAGTRMRAGYSEADWVTEQLKGVSNLFFLRQLESELDASWDSVRTNLEAIRSLLVRQAGMVINVTIDAEGWRKVSPAILAFVDALPADGPVAESWNVPLAPQPEGLSIPAKVNYVVKGTNLYRHGFEPHGSVSVITNLLRVGYLWDQIRVQGGAYGASCSFDLRSGVFGFGSYRDPNLRDTIRVYDEAASFLRDVVLDDQELTKNVIGAIGAIDAYRLPDAKGYTSMIRHLIGETDAQQQQYRDEVLGTDARDIRDFADALEQVARHGTVVVIGSQEAIEQAGDVLGDPPRLTALL